MLLLLLACHSRDLGPEEARQLLTDARATFQDADGHDVQRHYRPDGTVHQTDGATGTWDFWNTKLCTEWSGMTRCDHVVTNDRGTYWIERRTNAQEMPDAVHTHHTTSDHSPKLVQGSSSVVTFTSVVDATTGEDRAHVRPAHEVYRRELVLAAAFGLFVVLRLLQSLLVRLRRAEG